MSSTRLGYSPKELAAKYTRTTAYKQLVSQHSLSDDGLWIAYSEYTEAGRKELGVFQGKLEHVVDYVSSKPEFWSYGSGGTIEKLEVKVIDEKTAGIEQALQERRNELLQQLAEVEKQLNK